MISFILLICWLCVCIVVLEKGSYFFIELHYEIARTSTPQGCSKSWIDCIAIDV